MDRFAAILIVSLIFCFGCSSDGDKPVDVIEPIPSSDSFRRFVEGDTIGVYAVASDGGMPGDISYPSNVPMVYKSGIWETIDDKSIFASTSIQDVYAYFPYDSELGRLPGKLNTSAYPFSLSGDQSARILDILWAKAIVEVSQDNIARLDFRHVFAKFTINIITSDAEQVNSVEVHNVVSDVTVNLRNMAVTLLDERNVIETAALSSSEGIFTFEAIIAPQSIFSQTPLFLIKYDNLSTVYVCEAPLLIEAGRNYTFNVTVIPDAR